MEGLGISYPPLGYIKSDKYSQLDEFVVMQSMTKYVAEQFAIRQGLNARSAKVQFINYGDTELVFVLSYGTKRYTLLFGQPIAPPGAVKKEAALLKQYAKLDSETVVAPIKYFPLKQYRHWGVMGQDLSHQFEKEAYVTPYLHQARCIASQEGVGFGVYVPEPEYKFVPFTPRESEYVCACMIAKLVSLYDSERKAGISACKLSGGDFVLEKKWNKDKLDALDTLNCMKLTAARDEVHCTIDEYVDLIRKEFGKVTHYTTEEERDKSIIINHKSHFGMTRSAIEKGIIMGLELRRVARERKLDVWQGREGWKKEPKNLNPSQPEKRTLTLGRDKK